MSNSIVWFRNNLRTYNNSSLFNACKAKGKIIGIYILDPKMFAETEFGFKKTEKYRTQFLLETLQAVKEELDKKNISLLVYYGDTTSVLKEVCAQYDIENLYTQTEWTQEEAELNTEIKKEVSLNWFEEYDSFLVHPNDIPFESLNKVPDVFTAFRKKIEAKLKVRADFEIEIQPIENRIENTTVIPTLETLGFTSFTKNSKTAVPFKGGENEGKKRVEDYLFTTQNLSEYKKTRNGLIGKNYSSKFSLWLANGSLCPRYVYWQIKEYEETVEKNEDTYWLIFELLWRDYFRYISLKHKDKIFYKSGIFNKKYTWKNSKKAFDIWQNGKTEEPFVNANMIELKETGFMSNRGRQNVASFWAKEWEQNWLVGAAYFEALLIDYDVHSNYGNWIYNSGVGNDPRDRKFNIKRQADMYDPNQEYTNLWLNQ